MGVAHRERLSTLERTILRRQLRNTLTFLGVEAPAAAVVTAIALVFMMLVAVVNLGGVREGVATMPS